MLLDASGLLCLYDRDESRHAEAETFYNAATERVKHNYVLAEFIALTPRRNVDRESVLAAVAAIQDDPEIEVVWVDEALHLRGIILLQDRLDKDWSLCDAISILLMQQRGFDEALTTDRDFDQAGFRRLLPR